MNAAWHGPWLDDRLPHLAVRVWGVLSLSCGPASHCVIRARLLARALRVSPEAIDAALTSLVDAGYLVVEPEGSLVTVALTADQWMPDPGRSREVFSLV